MLKLNNVDPQAWLADVLRREQRSSRAATVRPSSAAIASNATPIVTTRRW
jgi:hypothetical protein